MMKIRLRIGTVVFMTVVLAAAALAAPAAPPANELTVQVEGLACPFCAHGLEKHLKKLKAVEAVEISLKTGEAVLRLKPRQVVTVSEVGKAVRRAGFTAGTVKLRGLGAVAEQDGQWRFTLRGTPAKYRLSEAAAGKPNSAAATPLTRKTQQALRRLAHPPALVAVSGEVRGHEPDLPELRLEHYEKVQ